MTGKRTLPAPSRPNKRAKIATASDNQDMTESCAIRSSVRIQNQLSASTEITAVVEVPAKKAKMSKPKTTKPKIAKAKTSKVLKTRKKPEPAHLPNEILIKIFRHLDVITATCWDLANQNFRAIYMDLAPKTFDRKFGGKYDLPIRLDVEVNFPITGFKFFLVACLETWMPPHLMYNPYEVVFVTPEAMAVRVARVREALEEEQEEKDRRLEEKLERSRAREAWREENRERREINLERKKQRWIRSCRDTWTRKNRDGSYGIEGSDDGDQSDHSDGSEESDDSDFEAQILEDWEEIWKNIGVRAKQRARNLHTSMIL